MSSVYSDFQGGYYMSEPAPEEKYIGAEASDGFMDMEHLRKEDLWGVQTKTFVATIKASLEDLANNPHKAKWELPAEAQRFLQKVTAQQGRTNSKEAIGDLSRTILLDAKVTGVRNEFPVDIGFDLQGLVPGELTGNGRHNYVVFANQPPVAGISEDIFEPDSLFNQMNYEKYGKLTPESVAREIVFSEHEPEFADIRIGGIAWDLLLKNAANDHYDDEVAKELQKVNDQLHLNPLTRKVQVPSDIAKELHDGIMAPLQQMEKSFVDMRRFQARFMRADGEAWNSFAGLVGDSIGLDAEDNESVSAHELVKENRCSVKFQLSYVSF
jgi:hypothetical protein